MNKSYKAALIGCGKIASQFADDPKIQGIYTHAGAYTACSQTNLIAVCDLSEVRALECATKWNVPKHYTDIRQMLEIEQPQIVSICTPDETHADMLSLVLNCPSINGIIIEKPIALDVSRATHLVQEAQLKNIALVVNYNRRYSKGHQKIKNFIAAGQLGEIVKLTGFYTKGIVHNGTHWLDLARWLVGDVVALQGFSLKYSFAPDPTIDAWLQFENNAIGYLHGLDADAYSLFEMDIFGSQGRIRINNSGYDIEYFQVADSPYFTGYKTLTKKFQEQDQISHTVLDVVTDVVKSIETAVLPTCSAQDGLKALSIAHQLIQSAYNNQRVNLNAE